MAIRIKLLQGESLTLDVDLADWNKAFQKALSTNAMLEVHDPRGRVLAINPHQVVYLEESGGADAEDATAAHEAETAAA